MSQKCQENAEFCQETVNNLNLGVSEHTAMPEQGLLVLFVDSFVDRGLHKTEECVICYLGELATIRGLD